MKFGYDDTIIEIAPELVAGIIWCRNISNHGSVEAIDTLLGEAEAHVRERYPSPPDIARDAAIAAWRNVYSRLGLKPNRYPCAAESLIRRVVTEGSVPRISPLVDLCNAASMMYSIPVAPFDLRHVEEFCVVRRASGEERYRMIGSDTVETPEPGEAVYVDATNELLSRRWNWRQTAKGAIQPDSTDILITTEAVHDSAHRSVEGVLAMFQSRVIQHLGGHAQVEVLTAEYPWSERTQAS
jgi:DNA/RNA-binding domain of Phe-tRNA-synthetase-like protein